MGFRFRKSIKAGPFRVNLSKSGVGYSIGGKGFRYTKKANGGTRTTLSIPGTGISYVDETSKKKRGIAMKKSGKQATAEHTPHTPSSQIQNEVLRIEGLNKFAANIKKLAKLNPDWALTPDEIIAAGKAGQRIFQCKFINTPVQLMPESDNAEDPYAISVTIAGLKVGYVDREMGEYVCWILKNCNIHSIACGMFGGKYKIVDESGNVTNQQCNISITVKLTYADVAQPLPAATPSLNTSSKQKAKFSKETSKKKPLHKRWWFWAIIVAFLLGSCDGESPASEAEETTFPAESAIIQETKDTTTPSETEATVQTQSAEDAITTGQKNALNAAKSYLDYSAFSYSGLVKQLEYEKYSNEDAVYAADNCGASWSEQALRAAQSYLAYSAFSHAGLIQQLEYEGYTAEQAAYGADNCGADWSEQAAKAAESYLEYSSFSRDGLIDQLEYEGYTSEQAIYGVDNCGAAWESPATTAAATVAPTEVRRNEITYVLNTNTMKFHYESCKSAAKIKAANRSSFTGTRDEVIAKGYSPCGNCHP